MLELLRNACNFLSDNTLETIVAAATVVSAVNIKDSRDAIQESRTVRAAEYRPVVTFTIEREGMGSDRDRILLKISNSGSRAAFDVRVSLTTPLPLAYVGSQAEDLRDRVGLLNGASAKYRG